MAWTFEQNMYGAPPIIQNFQIEEDCYVGQVVQGGTTNAHVRLPELAAAHPDVATPILGIIVGVVHSPTYDSTYQGDKATYDSAQTAQIANDPIGATEVQVAIARPGDMWRAPICKVTNGTALDTITVTTADTLGDDVIHTGAITAPTAPYATIYCRTGANRGQYRVIQAGGTTDQDVTLCFTYDIAVGDTFVAANVRLGFANIDFTTDFLGIDGDSAVTNHYHAFCHKLNLEESGKEFAVVAFHSKHMWWIN
jgi:hypothetical protein